MRCEAGLTALPPRYGFVEFEDSRDADDAVYELNGKDLCGERVIVEHARGPRRDRDGYSYSSRSECSSGFPRLRRGGHGRLLGSDWGVVACLARGAGEPPRARGSELLGAP